MKIKLKNIKNILKFKKDDYKYLSPCIFKSNNSYQLLYSNRKSKSKFTGQIESAKSLNLTKWTVNNKPYLIPTKNTKYVSFVSPNIATINSRKILFIEAQNSNYHSDIVCFYFLKNKLFLHPEFKIKNNKDNFMSPFYINYKGKHLLFYSKNGKYIECIELNKNLKIKNKRVSLKSEFSNEKFSIYAPTIIIINNKLHMLYSAWKNHLEGNINYAYSLDGINWIKKQKDVFEFKKNIKIISEPFFINKESKIYLFFEFKKKNNKWNISYTSLTRNFFC